MARIRDSPQPPSLFVSWSVLFDTRVVKCSCGVCNRGWDEETRSLPERKMMLRRERNFPGQIALITGACACDGQIKHETCNALRSTKHYVAWYSEQGSTLEKYVGSISPLYHTLEVPTASCTPHTHMPPASHSAHSKLSAHAQCDGLGFHCLV